MVTFNVSFTSFQSWLKEFVAEFIGTFLLVFIGNNSVAQSILTNGQGGNYVTIYFGYGFGLFLGVFIAGNVSGGHLNPAVSISGAIMKKFKWRKVPHYIVAQYLGAFIAACGTYAVYFDSFEAYHAEYGINRTTAGIFATYPKQNLSIIGSLIDQVFGSMVLIIGIYTVTDTVNRVPSHLSPIFVSLTLISIACSLGINQGFAVNPARDLAPRFFTYITCWGPEVFASSSYWYVPLIGPHLGALLGAAIYVFFIEKFRYHFDAKNQTGVASVEVITSKSKSTSDAAKADDYFQRF